MNNIDDMGRQELIELQAQIKSVLSGFKPYRIRERGVKCGKAGCWCGKSIALHGPYLYAVYRSEGRTKTASLGPKMEIGEMKDEVPSRPELADHLTVPDHKYGTMERNKTRGWYSVTISADQFRARYGLTEDEDKFSRPKKFWGSGASYDEYESEHELYLERLAIPQNPWAWAGVGTLSGIAILEGLEGSGYYLKV